MNGGNRQSVLRARHFEIHGRIAEGSAANKPVIEIALQLDQASAPTLHPAAAQPIDANVTGLLRGLNDFSPKPWSVRFREIQAAGGRIDITQARVQQGEILAVGGGSLSLNGNGRLEGQLRVTMAGLDQFLGCNRRATAGSNLAKYGQACRCARSTCARSRRCGASAGRRQYFARHQLAWRADHARRQASGNASAAFRLTARYFSDRSRSAIRPRCSSSFPTRKAWAAVLRQVRMRTAEIRRWANPGRCRRCLCGWRGCAVNCSNNASPSPLRIAFVKAETSSLKRPSISKTASLLARNTSRHIVGSDAAMRVKSRNPPAENFSTSERVTVCSSSAVPTIV